jgi:ribosomal protein L33
MKIKCPACGAENYFSGLENAETRFCSSCNEALFKIGKEKSNNSFQGSKQIINLQSSLEEIHEGIQLGTIEYKDIGKLLAEIFIKNILKSFDGKTFSWIHKDFKDTKKDTLLKEWVFFNMFLVVQAIQSCCKHSQKGIDIVQSFYPYSYNERAFASAGILKDPFIFFELLDSRFNMYSTAINKSKNPEDRLRMISKEFCKLCNNGLEYHKAGVILGIATYYAGITIAYKKLILRLIK